MSDTTFVAGTVITKEWLNAINDAIYHGRNVDSISVVNVKNPLFGATGDGTTDDTAAIQAAIDSLNGDGGIVYIPPGTYMTSSTLLLPSNTTLQGAGAVSLIKATAGWVATGGTPPSTGTGYCLVSNENSTAASITDEDITVKDLGFSFANLINVLNGGTFAVCFRMARRVKALNCFFSYGNNGTAFLACEETLSGFCYAEEIENCGFDHWEGTVRATVIGCTVIAASGGAGQGIQFTGTGSLLEDRNSLNFVAVGNTVIGFNDASASSIIVNTNDAGSTVYRFTISSNTIVDAYLGIVVQGNAGSGSIIGNQTSNGLGPQIFLQATSGTPRDITIVGNTFDNPQVDAGDIAVVTLAGQDHTFVGNRIRKGANTYPSCVWVAGTRIVVSGNHMDTGSGARFNVSGGTNYSIIDQKATGAARVYPLAAAPLTPEEGDMYMNNVTHKAQIYDGTTWQDLF